MKKIVLLSGDTKCVRELSLWLKELGDDTLVETFADPQKFLLRYGLPPDEADAAEAAAQLLTVVPNQDVGAKKAELDMDALGALSQRHFPISLLIVDLQLLATDPLPWILDAVKKLATHGYSNAEAPTRILVIGYGDTDFDLDRFRVGEVDDLLMMPLDKALFQQKAEMHLAEAGSVRASFLFKQRTNLVIEMGKDTFLETISEVGFAIRNPAPLTAGVFAQVYSEVFGKGGSSGLIGRVYRSERHPTIQNTYLCYLSYFGITNEQLATIRRWLRQEKQSEKQTPPKKLADPSTYDDLPIRNVAVVDMNADARETVRSALESNFANVRVFSFPSYSSFLKFCSNRIPGSGGEALSSEHVSQTTGDEIPGAAKLTLAGASEINFLVDGVSGELISIEPSPKQNAKILGIDAKELMERPSAWLNLLKPSDKEEIAEFLSYLRSGQQGQLVLEADGGPELGPVQLRMRGRIESVGEVDGSIVVRLILREITHDEVQQNSSHKHSIPNLHGLYVDGSLLGEHVAASVEGLLDLLRKANMLESREAFVLTVLADERSRLKPHEYRIKGAQDFLFKSIDRKMVLGKAALLIRGLVEKTDVVDLNYRKCNSRGRITKEVLMEEVSEFGLQIRHGTPLREHTFLRFFSPVFLDERGIGLLGRCLYSTKDPDTGQFHCFFNFFGVTDAQLKHIRNWIRGDYASKKEKSGSGS